jgi:hypothetical protein
MAADLQLPSGSDWSVTQAPGGYLVTVDLAKKLPMISDAPTIEVDGTPIGIATESADGLSLSVFTTDAAVASASSAEAGWFSKPSGGTTPKRTAADVVAPEADAEPLDANPSSIGKYAVTESVYNFGTQAIPLAAIGGIRGEMQGKIYLPKTTGARPTVVLLHGRHTSCGRVVADAVRASPAMTAPPARWPATATPSSRSRPTRSTPTTTSSRSTVVPRPVASCCWTRCRCWTRPTRTSRSRTTTRRPRRTSR